MNYAACLPAFFVLTSQVKRKAGLNEGRAPVLFQSLRLIQMEDGRREAAGILTSADDGNLNPASDKVERGFNFL